MLVLSRMRGESVLIQVPGPNNTTTTIRVQITDIGYNKVKIGVDAPRQVFILRQELANRYPEAFLPTRDVDTPASTRMDAERSKGEGEAKGDNNAV